jgi:hypothetical protein
MLLAIVSLTLVPSIVNLFMVWAIGSIVHKIMENTK